MTRKVWKALSFVVALAVVLAAQVSAQPLAQSTFDTDDEGWIVTAGGTTAGVTYFATGGNPGGHIRGADPSGIAFWYFTAPAKFYGDMSTAYQQTLDFDVRQVTGPGAVDQVDVFLSGGGLTLEIDAGPNPGLSWTSYNVPLVETAGWLVQGTGVPPTQGQMQSVLSALTDLRIRGEFLGGADQADLDNVVLNAAAPVPALDWPGLLLLTGLLLTIGILVSRRMTRHPLAR